MAGKDPVLELSTRAAALHHDGRYTEAIDCLRVIEILMPGNPDLEMNFGALYRDSGELARSERSLRRVLEARPDDPAAHFQLGLTLLRAGRLREGFEEYEWRWQLPQFDPQRRAFAQPLWRGEPLNGRRLLLWSEQGAGDTIQFARFAPLVPGAILDVLPHLRRLFAWMEDGIPLASPGAAFDLHCPLMSLPHRLGTALDSIPAPAQFRIPDDASALWRARISGPGLRIGLTWTGNPNQAENHKRSIPPAALAPLLRLPGTHWFSLAVDAAAPDGAENLAPLIKDFADTAAAISLMDLIITVDTATAHLAASLGRPVWLLASYASDWRWMMHRQASPWYPTMRIFRQIRPNDWTTVVARVTSRIEADLI